MKRAVVIVAIFAALGFMGGFLYAQLTKEVIPTVKEQRRPLDPRTVPANWPEVRMSPGHSQHLINEPVDCNECHDPTKPVFDVPDTGVCTQCHEEQAKLSHVNPDGMPMDCYTCHIFGSQPEVFGRWHCTRCHGPFQSKQVEDGLAMHATVPCETCHNPHKPTDQTILDCGECHEKMNVRHGRPQLSGTCSDCHGGHKLASEAAACMDCHGKKEPIIPASATFGGGHETCVSCHEPHSFSASTAARCNSCHQGVRVLAQNAVKEHRDCNSCHQPHSVRAASGSVCKSCHEDVASTHPAQKQGDCVGCHEPHPRRVTQVALRCSQCHEEAGSDRAFHAGKTECTGCHEPHRFDLSMIQDRALCRRCHVPQVRLTSRNLGHSSCMGCHQGTAHEPGGLAACGSCHERQVTKSPKGHRECLTCHEPHAGKVLPQTSCTGCHEVAQLPGLHRLPNVPIGEGHTDCTTCHGIHDERVRDDRATCVSCHEDMINHQPDAKVCSGCHTFISGRRR